MFTATYEDTNEFTAETSAPSEILAVQSQKFIYMTANQLFECMLQLSIGSHCLTASYFTNLTTVSEHATNRL